MQLYTQNGARPAPLPRQVIDPRTGMARTDPEQFRQDGELLALLGFQEPPEKPTITEDQSLDWYDGDWLIVEPQPPIDATQALDSEIQEIEGQNHKVWSVRPKNEAELQRERRGMVAFKRAINYVLSSLPPEFSPQLSQSFPDATSVLELVDSYTASLEPYDPLRIARQDIIEYIRLHPDVAAFQQVLGATDEQIDMIFREAMSFEARGT